MYVVFNIDHTCHLLNEPKMINFAHNNDRGVYVLSKGNFLFNLEYKFNNI